MSSGDHAGRRDDGEASEIQVGGPVTAGEQLYIERATDLAFLEWVRAGEFINVVTSRQMGKTSLVYRAMGELAPAGFRFAYFDLSPLRTEPRPQVYYQSIVKALTRELRLDLDLTAFWAGHADEALSQAFIDFFRELLARVDGPVVIVLDEIDSTLERDFTDDLFTAIRSLYTSRPRDAALRRLSFCLVGVATPNELIKAPRTTPYNIGRTLWLDDFDPARDDLAPFAHALGPDPATAASLLGRVLHWTAGQPYLTAQLCEQARSQGSATPEAIDGLVEASFRSLDGLHHDAHFEQTLRFISERVANSGEVLGLYERLLVGERVPDQAANPAFAALKLAGLARRDADGCLVPRNRIYQRLFNLDWVRASKPQQALARARRTSVGALAALVLAVAAGFVYYQTGVVPLEQQKHALQSREVARQELEKLQVTLERDSRGFTTVGLPRQARATVLQRALAPLQTLGSGADAIELAIELSGDDAALLPLLEGLPSLARLVVRGPAVVDLRPVAAIKGLKELDFSDTAVAELGPLAGLSGLRRLSAAHTQVADLTPLAGLRQLEVLELGNTPVKNLAPLAGLTALREVDLSNTAVDDLAPLAGLTRLENLDLSRSRVRNLDALRQLPALRHLALDGLGLRGFRPANGAARVLEDPPATGGARPRPGEVFRDCPACPQLVAVKEGRFMMGSPAGEAGRDMDEDPQHKVQLRPFAVARYETRADEWALCVADGACKPADDAGFGRGARPVVWVSWDAAQAYVQWLSKKSGLEKSGLGYRLLSEAEWEYAARAGSTTARPWGDAPDQACDYANVADATARARVSGAGDWAFHNCSDGHAYTAPVGSYRPNAFGLYDMIGNVWEWTADCYHDSYRNAPEDGLPWLTGNCDTRVPRGGAWSLFPRGARSAFRFGSIPGNRSNILGFRLARTLP